MQVALLLENGPGAKVTVVEAFEDPADAEHQAADRPTRTVLVMDVRPSTRARSAQAANALTELASSHQPAAAGYSGWAGGQPGVGAGYDRGLGTGPTEGHGGIGASNLSGPGD